MGLITSSVVSSVPTATRTMKVFNETIASADTEQSLVLPTEIVGYMIRSRSNFDIKLTHVATESGTKFVTIPKKSTFTDDHAYSGLTLYFQSPDAGGIVEIVTWE